MRSSASHSVSLRGRRARHNRSRHHSLRRHAPHRLIKHIKDLITFAIDVEQQSPPRSEALVTGADSQCSPPIIPPISLADTDEERDGIDDVEDSRLSLVSTSSKDGRTHEHALLAFTLGVRSIIVADEMNTCKWCEDRFKETSTFIQNKVAIPAWRSYASTVPALRGSYPVRLARAFSIIFSGRYHPELCQVALALALTVRLDTQGGRSTSTLLDAPARAVRSAELLLLTVSTPSHRPRRTFSSECHARTTCSIPTSRTFPLLVP
ncbi:hypothetical protein CF326_g9000 [Tilletia indica]|nr:hypothetical protein CF326_g9000 [Tilletia indica]